MTVAGLPFRSVAFDLDGTLVDSAADIHAAVNRVLDEHGHEPLPLPIVRGFIGNGVPVLIERVMQARGIPAVDGHHLRLCRAFDSRYGEAPAVLTTLYPGVDMAVRELKRAGYRLGICTNKPADLARAVLDAFDLAVSFDAIVGGDSLPVRKPDPLPLITLQRSLGTSCIYVGDSEVDAETAARAGRPFALFLGGYCRVGLGELRCDHSFDSFAELPAIVRRLNASAEGSASTH